MRVSVCLLIGLLAGAAFGQAPRPPIGVGGIVCTFDGNGSAITAGTKFDIKMPYAALIVGASMLADRSGSVVVEIRKCTYAQYDAGATHRATGDKISASAPPTISSGTKSDDTTLTGWTKTFAKDDVIEFYVNSAATIRKLTVVIRTDRLNATFSSSLWRQVR